MVIEGKTRPVPGRMFRRGHEKSHQKRCVEKHKRADGKTLGLDCLAEGMASSVLTSIATTLVNRKISATTQFSRSPTN